MPKQVYVHPHSWSKGKNGTHPGYHRAARGKGKKLIKQKPYTVRVQNVTDEYGQLRPETSWKIIKR